jgi:hypothetical protein
MRLTEEVAEDAEIQKDLAESLKFLCDLCVLCG